MEMTARWRKEKEDGSAKAGREWVVGEEKEQARVWLFSWGWGLFEKPGPPAVSHRRGPVASDQVSAEW